MGISNTDRKALTSTQNMIKHRHQERYMKKTAERQRLHSVDGENGARPYESTLHQVGLLSREDLVSLTEYMRSADQRRWLDANAIPYRTGARGTPKVLWSDLQHHQSPQGGVPDWRNLPKAK